MIWYDAWVCLYHWVVILVTGYFNFPLYCTVFWWVSKAGYIMALRSYSVLDILLPPIIIIIQDCSQVLNACKCLSSLSCGGVSNMLVVPSISFHCHCNIWGCVQLAHFSLGDWQDISINYVIVIIKSEVSSLPIVILFFCGCVPEMFVASYSLTYCIYIPGEPRFCLHHYCAVHDVWK